MRKLVFIIMFLMGCGSKKNDVTPPAKAPARAVLLSPAKDAVCVSGTVQSTTQSSVTLDWDDADNTDNYEVNLKNLLTGVVAKYTSAGSGLTVTLQRGTPYAWWVMSRSSTSVETAQSDTWKFYNAGEAATSYAPFPAEAISPVMGETMKAVSGKVTLQWKGSDPDNDITGYDVYFGAQVTPGLLKSTGAAIGSMAVEVVAGTVYYWKVVTRDGMGNRSESGVFQFKAD